MRLIVVDELLNGVIHPPGHYSLLDNAAGCDTFAFGLCLLTRRLASSASLKFSVCRRYYSDVFEENLGISRHEELVTNQFLSSIKGGRFCL
jgi:hypothetical protein